MLISERPDNRVARGDVLRHLATCETCLDYYQSARIAADRERAREAWRQALLRCERRF